MLTAASTNLLPRFETNVKGTFILEVARRLRVTRFVHISTDEVYGDIPGRHARGLKTLRSSRAVPIPLRKLVRIFLFAPTCAPIGFPD